MTNQNSTEKQGVRLERHNSEQNVKHEVKALKLSPAPEDEKHNEELLGKIPNKALGDILNKARQQGIDNTIIECEKKKELWIDRERKSVYEQGKEDECNRIIEMISEEEWDCIEVTKMIEDGDEDSIQVKAFLMLSSDIQRGIINSLCGKLLQLKNSEAMRK